MPNVTIYTTAFCHFCYRAKMLLDSKGLSYEENDLNMTPGARLTMTQRSDGCHTVPQIFIGETHIGGCEDLYTLGRESQLDRHLSS